MPDRIVPPAVVVQAGSPYLGAGSVFGTFLARWEVLVVGAVGANEKAQDALDEAAENAVVELVNAGYTVESVSQPYALSANNAQYPTIEIQFTKEIRL